MFHNLDLGLQLPVPFCAESKCTVIDARFVVLRVTAQDCVFAP